MTLSVEQVYSGYRQTPVIKDISFTIEAGQIVVLIGLNGAGKSTLLKTILGLLQPQQGEIQINGHSILMGHQLYARQVAYIPETPVLYKELTLKEHLMMTGLGYGLSEQQVLQRAQPLLELFRLDKVLDWFPIHFSKGMQQKVMIVCALITDATVYIIDEPFLGLDPIAIHDFTQIIQDRARQGAHVLFTTHMLSLAEQLCHHYLILNQGHLVAQGDLPALRVLFDDPNATLDDIYLAMTHPDVVTGLGVGS